MGRVHFAMPLLSTLAALVIIVHSAEENYEKNHRVLRPRALEQDIYNYDQPWKAADIEPKMRPLQSGGGQVWEESSPEQSMRRRRPVRKRKRRPHLPLEDDLLAQEKSTYNDDESQPYHQENIERPRRRRKKINDQEPSEVNEGRWNEEELDRPKRRRGYKRKRPLDESLPELSEFGGHRQQGENNNSEESKTDKEPKYDSFYDYQNEEKKPSDTTIVAVDGNIKQYQPVQPDEDKSLAEFSIESLKPKQKPDITLLSTKEKLQEKAITVTNDVDQHKIERILLIALKKVANVTVEKYKDKIRKLNKRAVLEGNKKNLRINEESRLKAPLDPIMLKDLLKKSNGKSLSEMLQQNNLSLADLLQGREKAISILKMEGLQRAQNIDQNRNINTYRNSPETFIEETQVSSNQEFNETKKVGRDDKNTEIVTTTQIINTTEQTNFSQKGEYGHIQEEMENTNQAQDDVIETPSKAYLRRRFPGGIRRKLRTRPYSNNTYKGELSRDLIAMTSIKYKNRNISKSREWKEILPSIIKTGSINAESNFQTETISEVISTTPCTSPETTTEELVEMTTDGLYTATNTESVNDLDQIESLNTADSKRPNIKAENINKTQFTTTLIETEPEIEIVTEKLHTASIIRPLVKASDLRRQAFNNRLKRKRLQQRTSTPQTSEEFEVENNFNVGKYVTASEFITKTQKETTKDNDREDLTTLEDFFTTESTENTKRRYRFKKPVRNKTNTLISSDRTLVTTEETAKFEIEEILKDNLTNVRLSKILKERNMTLRELVEHRERGSSHVHLADIFHNASREPNPPEPFLSKSLLEPISKETYPLRALLEANLHDPKTTTIDPSLPQPNHLDIPVVMKYGKNVNENSENMGILSLFNNFSKSSTDDKSFNDGGIIYTPPVLNENLNRQGATREGRMASADNDSVTWNDLITLIRKNHQSVNNDVYNPSKDTPTSETLKKIHLDEDLDGDGLIVLDDLQRLSNLESKKSSNEMLELQLYERNKYSQVPNVSNAVLNNTTSVTVATASIIGLALILFLLTYAILKWKQQNKMFQNKHAKEDDCVPTPVFENRKGHKINSSTRSKSPMLATSNIYTIESIDTHAGSDSPEYMWDTLRKPFQ